MDTTKRPNRHSNPSRYPKKHKGRFMFFKAKNRAVRQTLEVLA